MTDDARGGRPPWALGLPKDGAEIEAIHRARTRVAVERARRSALLGPRVSGIRVDRLDDPKEWRKIPVLTKKELRRLPTEVFYRDFCIQPIAVSRELWGSGGATGKPLFYLRSAEDLDYALGVGSAASGRASGPGRGTSSMARFALRSLRPGPSGRPDLAARPVEALRARGTH